MLGLAVVFLMLSVAAGAFGFGGIAATAIESGQFLFGLFVALFVISLIGGLSSRR